MLTKAQFRAAFPKGNLGFRLLTPGNPKVNKGLSEGYWTFILHLAPASLSGFEVCPMRTLGCTKACLNTAGRGGIAAGGLLDYDKVAAGKRNQIQSARIRKTRAYFEHRQAFMSVLVSDINRAIAMAARDGFVPVFRLNGTSDIRWETVRDANGRTIFDHFPTVQFYDYTKLANRKHIPANYHLTFSLADGNEAQATHALANGINVAAVYRDKATVARIMQDGARIAWTDADGADRATSWPVFIGDDSDLRFLDPRGRFGTVIALYAKGNAKRDRSGFVRD